MIRATLQLGGFIEIIDRIENTNYIIVAGHFY